LSGIVNNIVKDWFADAVEQQQGQQAGLLEGTEAISVTILVIKQRVQ
jgi:hypothetical protein